MAIFNVDSVTLLRNAINSAGNGDTINITADQIVIDSPLPTITKDLTFTSAGNNATISGGGSYQIFTVTSGNVTFTNLTIANGRAVGVDGSGTAGQGGALRINGGNVTLINTNFEGNEAEGGRGSGSAGSNGGDGQGGAIYVNGGTLRINNTSFVNNTATGGQPGTGSNGQVGKSQGGAIYINAGSVIAEGTPRFQNNAATEGPNTLGAGFQTFTKPFVQSINRANPDPTAQNNLDYTVVFSENVVGVDAGDFSVVEPNSQNTITGEGVISVTPVSSSTYKVTINTGSGNGSLQLKLNDNDSIKSASAVPIGGTGLGNGSFPGQIYTINKTPPTVTVKRKDNALEATAAETVAYTVAFSETVNGIDTDANGGFRNFQVLVPEGSVSGAQVVSVTPVKTDPNTNTAYTVTVKTGTGNGKIQLRLVDDDTITSKLRGVPLGGTGIGNGNVDGDTYAINKTPPTVAAIERIGNSPTGDATVSFKVTFTQDVTGVTNDDFVPVTSGVQGANIAAITQTDARTYTVAVNTGSGDGSLGLNVNDNDSIKNGLGVGLGGNGAGNGNANGPSFAILKSAPLVSSINLGSPNPTAAGTVNYIVTFNQDVTGVDRTDFRLSGAGITGFSTLEVSGSGKTYTVVANTGTGSGTLALNLVDNDSIRNSLNAPLGGGGGGNGNFTGQSYTVTKSPPRVTGINRLEASPTNAATVNFTVSFNEAVSRVDPSDFTLVTQGVTGAGITNVTRINDSFYSVAVATGQGDGSIGLSLIDNDSIINSLGLTLGGAGANNGSFRGEAFSIDRTAPTADIIDVGPDPREDKVDAITITFNEAVKGFDLADLQLTRDGERVGLDQATLTSSDGITWTLGNLRKLTNDRGDYTLGLNASGSGITDAAGNPLATNASDQWRNLVDVEVCDPGIVRRGTKGANQLKGTEDSDTLIGFAGNDVLTGLDCRDRLDGGKGDDQLIGGKGGDTLLGGTGADRFIYSGNTEAEALENSLASTADRIKKFNFSQSDKFQLDFNNNRRSQERPKGLFNAGQVKGKTLEQAAKNAYRDKDRSESNAQTLESREAVFFDWNQGTYLSVNDRQQSFAIDRDLVINVSGIQFRSGDSSLGSLNVSNYFV